jgi:hypothetical protein
MLRQVVVCITLALLVSASAQGSIDQGQGFSIGAANMVNLVQEGQSAQWNQNLVIDLTQSSDGGSGLMLARVNSVGFSGVIGGGLGLSSLLGVSQAGMIPALGASSLLIPSVGSANTLIAQARLNSLLLMAR